MQGDPVIGRRGRTVCALLLGLLLAHFAFQTVRLGLDKRYSIDEFQYAHAAWLVAQGDVPYRDFFEVHHPLLYQVFSPVFLLGGDEPGLIWFLRLGMLGILALTVAALWRLNAGRSRWEAWGAVLFLLLMLPFTDRATEVRNDALAFALFAWVLALLTGPVATAAARHRRALVAGALLALAVWGTQKAVYYGAIFAAAFIVDLAWHRPRRQNCLLLSPWRFAGGFLAVAGLIAGYLAATGSADAWWRWCVAWAFQIERDHVEVPWTLYLGEALLRTWWIAGLAVVGVVTTMRELSRDGHPGGRADLLLLLALPSSFVAHAAQKASYPYNLIPLLGLLAVFAARGVGACVDRSRAALAREHTGAPFAALVGLLLAVLLVLRAHNALDARIAQDNRHQHEVLARLGELTDPADVCYDNSGSFVARPHATFMFYTERTTRRRDADALARTVPASILDSGAVLMLRDRRFETLPGGLKAFLRAHFQPYSGDLWLWGQRYEVHGNGMSTSFLAVRDDLYFVEPPDLAEQGRLLIDGEAVVQPVFRLGRGEHRVQVVGESAPFSLLWLPRNGERYEPQPTARPRFSVVF